ncbi:MAG TPA: N-acetylglucosamine-6-phosphate deacetylase [Chloroflexota bacterium]|nr:N-acetylglucosamine-6-phosphate deacetylase [Chloroflexota bacterium]
MKSRLQQVKPQTGDSERPGPAHDNPPLLITGGVIFTPDRRLEDHWLLIDGGVIAEMGQGTPPSACEHLDATGLIVAPGFVDLHLHGGGGADVMDASPDALETIAAAHAKGGTTGWVGSTVAAPLEEIHRALKAAQEVVGKPLSGATMLGVHLEGPYLCADQRGAHRLEYLHAPTPPEYQEIFSHLPGKSRVTAAPEVPGALEMGREMARRGLHGAIGHSAADIGVVRQALDSGYSHVTHLYSCTSGLRIEGGYKTPGIQEAALLFDDLTVELIGDGYHVPPSLIQLVVKVKGPESVCLVTDAMRAAGLGPGSYRLGDSEVIVEHGVAKLPDRSKFAGSVCTMGQAVRTAVAAGIALEHALAMASSTPSRLLGLSASKGSIVPGSIADLVLLSNSLEPMWTLVGGRVVHASSGQTVPSGA